MDRVVNILILLAIATFIIGIGVGYGYVVRVFPAGTFWRFSIGCLAFASTLILRQIRDKG